jgi:tetratricopeptide (TPR) repeat protein
MFPLTAFLIFFMGTGSTPDLNTLLKQSESLVNAGQTTEALLVMTRAESLITPETPIPVKRLVFYRLGYLHTKTGNHETAGTYLEKAYNLKQPVVPEDMRVLLKISNIYIEELFHTENLEKATQLWRKTDALYKNELAANSSGFNHAVLGIRCLTLSGETSDAFDLAEKAFQLLKLKPELSDKRKALYAVTTSLAEAFKEKKNYEPAVTLYQRIFDLEENLLTPLNPALLPLCFILADAYWWDSKSLYTYHYYELASKIAGKDDNHQIELGKAYFGMAEVIASWNNNNEAEPWFQKALKLMTENLPKDSPELKALHEAIERNQKTLKERK